MQNRCGPGEAGKKPKTFTFLGFTHYCSQSKTGFFRVKRKTSKDKVRVKLKSISLWMKKNRHMDVKVIMRRMGQVLTGYYNYYCITDNTSFVKHFRDQVVNILYHRLNRRSQRKSYTWEKFKQFLKKYNLPRPRVKVNIYDLSDELKAICK